MNEISINVIACVVDDKAMTLYKTDGTTYVIPQGDPRLRRIIEETTPILARREVAVVNLIDTSNPYVEYEEKSGGLVRFFRVAKSKLKSLFGAKDEQQDAQPIVAMTVGQVPTQTLPDIQQHIVSQMQKRIGISPEMLSTPQEPDQTQTQKIISAVDEIIAHAVPAKSPDFGMASVGEEHSQTVVAVVGNQVIEGVEKLKPQIAHAVSLGSTKGMDAFMKRVAVVAGERRHSVEDLLKFLERGDLPIAEDGSIVIYKVLRKNQKRYRPDYPEHTYVDCHTSRVPQRVGSYVCMSPSLVDHDRRNECSNGLHVARRAYLGGFSGDVVVLAKVAPEDVIAVPSYDANKMRVCGYHILFELSAEAFAKLKSNRPFTDNEEAKVLLGQALAGDHPPVFERVEITGQKGDGVVVTPVVKEPVKTKAKVKPETNVEAPKAEALNIENGEKKVDPVDPRALANKAAALVKEVESRAEKAKRLWSDFQKAKSNKAKVIAAKELLDHKKAVKLGWKALGLPEDAGTVLAEAVKA